MRIRPLLNPSVNFEVTELRERPAVSANEMVMMTPVRELVSHAAVFEWHPADHLQFEQEFDCAKDGCTADGRQFGKQVLNRERFGRLFDRVKDGTPRSG